MTELSRKVLDAITQKREAAAAQAIKALQLEEQFKTLFADLLETFQTLAAANVATARGCFVWQFNRVYDDQRRLQRFEGITFGFGPCLAERPPGYSTPSTTTLRFAGEGYTVVGTAAECWQSGFYERWTKLGKRDSYCSITSYTTPARGCEAQITAILVDYIASVADR